MDKSSIFVAALLAGFAAGSISPKSLVTPPLVQHTLLTEKLIQVESKGNRFARGSAGEVGLMQIKPSTAQGIAQRLLRRGITSKDLEDPLLNLVVGQAYLLDLIEQLHDLRAGIQAYNVGPTAYKNGIRNKYVKRVLGSKGL